MNRKNEIPLISIQETLGAAGEHWHASDHYIARMSLWLPVLSCSVPTISLFICVEGTLKGKVNQNMIELDPYCLTASAPGTEIELLALSPGCKGRFLFFTRDFLMQNNINPPLIDAFHYLSEQVGFCIRLEAKEAAILLQLYDILLEKRTADHSAYHIEIIRTLFFTFVYEAAAIYKKNTAEIPHRLSRYKELHYKFSELLVAHDKTEQHLKFYADALFITPKYLIHAIKSACGNPPGALIDEATLAEAIHMLRDDSIRMADIAVALKFSEQAAFSKFFKRHTGLSPSAYRNQILIRFEVNFSFAP